MSNIDAGYKGVLLRAAGSGDEAVVQRLFNAHQDARDHFGRTALTFAASAGYEVVVGQLLQRGDFNPDARTKDGSTPLICSAWYGHEVVMRLLLGHGADANAKNEAGQTALWCASRNGHDRVVRLLLMKENIDLNSPDTSGMTPLWQAIHRGHTRVLQLLLERDDVDPNPRDSRGRTPLMVAAKKGHEAVVLLLLGRDEVNPDANCLGWNALLFAANHGHEAVVRLLLKQEDVSMESRKKALRLAARAGHETVVGLLQEEIRECQRPANSRAPCMNEFNPEDVLQPARSETFIEFKKRMFNTRKHEFAYDFFSELDDKLTGGQIASKTASGGGIKIRWSKTLKTTAGRTNWRREEVISQSSGDASLQSVTYRLIALIELSEELIDDEHRLLNAVAHQICHLACFLISHVSENHGKVFKEWGKKCSRAFGHRGVIVTTMLSYGACGVKIKRNRKDILALLPNELSLTIAGYLNVESLCRAAQVSHTWRSIFTDDLIWKRRFDNDGFVLADGELEWWSQPNLFSFDTSGLSAMRSERESSTSSNPLSQLKMIKGPYAASLYRRHHLIKKDWMENVGPRHIAISAYPRNSIKCLQFDSEKMLAAAGDEDTYIDVYDIKTGALRKRLKGHEGGVWGLEFHGNILVSFSTDCTVRVWDIEKGVCTHVFICHEMARCLKILLPARFGTMPDGQAKMGPEMPLIIAGCGDSNIRVWKLPLPGDKPAFPTESSQDELECPYFLRTLAGHHDKVRAIAAHEDTLVSGSYDCTVRVWKTSTGETLHCLQGHAQRVYSVVLDHKRNRCISGSKDNIVKVWCLETGAELFNLHGYTNLLGLLDFSHDLLVSAAANSTLRIWNSKNGQCKSTLSADPEGVTCFQHDGQKVVAGSGRTVKMWNVQNGEFARDLLTDLTVTWQVKFDERRCVAAVKRNEFTFIEVLDFGASRDGVSENKCRGRIVVDELGREVRCEDT